MAPLQVPLDGLQVPLDGLQIPLSTSEIAPSLHPHCTLIAAPSGRRYNDEPPYDLKPDPWPSLDPRVYARKLVDEYATRKREARCAPTRSMGVLDD